MTSPTPERPADAPGNFIEDRIAAETEQAGAPVRVHTRFPPEPNGFLHIGHAKSICLNFGLARKFDGKCNLRFDDTNPETEETLFVRSIEEDVRWLGFEWNDRTYYASDYFEQLYGFAVTLIQKGKAYVDSRSTDEIRATRGDYHKKGEDSPHRARTVDENLDLFARMKAGEFPDGAHVLRA
ncbi:MAG: glutamate--tRNA ligase family protein, partial [Polyangiaceae bacterium]